MAIPDEVYSSDEPGEALFHQAARLFSIWRALKSGMLAGFLFGYHERLINRRVERLGRSTIARKLRADLATLTDQQSALFLGLATVNKEQAEAAARYTAIVNFTAPVTAVVIVNQVFPDFFAWLFGTYLEFGPVEVGLTIALFILAILWPVFHAYFSVGLARDLYHIALIDGSRRGSGRGSDVAQADSETFEPADL